MQLAEVIILLCTYVKKLDVLSVWPLKGTQIISTVQLCYLKYPQGSIAEDFDWSLWTTGPMQRVEFEIKSKSRPILIFLYFIIITCTGVP